MEATATMRGDGDREGALGRGEAAAGRRRSELDAEPTEGPAWSREPCLGDAGGPDAALVEAGDRRRLGGGGARARPRRGAPSVGFCNTVSRARRPGHWDGAPGGAEPGPPGFAMAVSGSPADQCPARRRDDRTSCADPTRKVANRRKPPARVRGTA